MRESLKLLRKIATQDFALSFLAIDFSFTKLQPFAKIFQNKSVDLTKAKLSLNKVVGTLLSLDRNLFAKTLLNDANQMT